MHINCGAKGSTRLISGDHAMHLKLKADGVTGKANCRAKLAYPVISEETENNH